MNWCSRGMKSRRYKIETKKSLVECLKRHHSNVRSMKTIAVLMEDGEFALIFRPHPREFAISRGEKSANAPGVRPRWRGGGWGALGAAPKGVLGISSDGNDRRIYSVLKFSIPGFFWVRKFGKYFFG